MRRWVLRVGGYTLLLVLGVAVALVGSFVQQQAVYAGGVSWPVGVVIALAGCAGLFFGGAELMEGPAGAGLPAMCWLVVALVIAYGGGGDVVLPNSTGALLYLFGGVLLAAASMLWIRFRHINQRVAEAERDRATRGTPPNRRTPGVSDPGRRSKR